jgi:hypothetical protein
MLQDPEKPFEEWEEDVWASSLDAARGKCELIAAEDPLIDLLNVTQARKTPTKQGDYLFTCWFRTEVTENDNSNN